MDSVEYAVRSLLIQQKLVTEGAVFGNQALNFCVDNLSLPKDDLKLIEEIALLGFQNLMTCRPSKSTSFNESEKFLNNLSLKPNGARVDIILTKDGPKIIEVNCQWVDGIQSLEGLKSTFLGNVKPLPSELLASQFKKRDRLAILYLNSATGSRSTGEQRSLNKLASNFMESNQFSVVEVIDPEKYRSEYLSGFSSIYINGDPRMLFSGVPDWMLSVFNNSATQIFPAWNPEYDKKEILSEASTRWPSLFAKTIKFTDRQSEKIDLETPNQVLKGDGFSSRQVAFSGTPLYANIWQDAEMFQEDYVLQEKIESTLISPTLAFDTSSNTPVFLTKPFCKFNVWIIGNKVAGTMASLSESKIISDKDFNTVPIPC